MVPLGGKQIYLEFHPETPKPLEASVFNLIRLKRQILDKTSVRTLLPSRVSLLETIHWLPTIVQLKGPSTRELN